PHRGSSYTSCTVPDKAATTKVPSSAIISTPLCAVHSFKVSEYTSLSSEYAVPTVPLTGATISNELSPLEVAMVSFARSSPLELVSSVTSSSLGSSFTASTSSSALTSSFFSSTLLDI